MGPDALMLVFECCVLSQLFHLYQEALSAIRVVHLSAISVVHLHI